VNSTLGIDPELGILSRIRESSVGASPHVRQRELARAAGISLGMTNSIIKRLVQKGWVSIRRVNNRNIQYAVSPAGVREIGRRTCSLIRRTFRDIALYRDAVHRIVKCARAAGCDQVVLLGRSDVDFIVEHCCALEGLRFAPGGDPHGPGAFAIYGERPGRHAGECSTPNAARLADLVVRGPAVSRRQPCSGLVHAGEAERKSGACR
jgi:DNA-binding MarR family transcriptional regulator